MTGVTSVPEQPDREVTHATPADPTRGSAGHGASSGQDAIDFRDVEVTFQTDSGPLTAVENFTASINRGEFVSLLGPSGCGKSTMLRVTSDLISPTKGSVEVLGHTPAEARRKRLIGFVFQAAALLPWRTALENVNLPLEIGKRSAANQDHGDPMELLEMVGLGQRAGAMPQELSGGMQQRVSIARALVTKPDILLMDEPFGALDEITRETMNKELLRIWQETGTTILFVTHSIPEAVFLSQRILVLSPHPGRIAGELDIQFDRDRDYSLRDSKEFGDYAAEARHLLHGGTNGHH